MTVAMAFPTIGGLTVVDYSSGNTFFYGGCGGGWIPNDLWLLMFYCYGVSNIAGKHIDWFFTFDKVLLPEEMSGRVRNHPELHQMMEVVMDLGRKPLAMFPLPNEVLFLFLFSGFLQVLKMLVYRCRQACVGYNGVIQ
ncbi:uncharacterized protein LOC131632426 [Vicia villosa]|uniref:uncharacterized protein LOC131632426 n=1 Tax=Vicia villosa TaxID=3911 RepID=UPI00273B4747|nr:uncharacterized protein LOC131632426 [Vicia villosa]